MATTPTSWTSEAHFARALLIAAAGSWLAACGVGWVSPAEGAPRKKPVEEPIVAPEPTPAPEPVGPEAVPSPFASPLPAEVGALPTGLAHLGAQSCNACHYEAHDTWAGSAHAVGWRSEAFRAAVREVGTPACTVCHLPLAAQHDQRWTFDDDRVDHPVLSPNPDWDASLATEGVTCAACHVRDGAVLTASAEVAGRGAAPHPLAWAPTLGTSEGCAACHQLSWPGADVPFYDTYGEWQRSPQAAAGVTCQDCHLGAGAGEPRGGVDHGVGAAAGRAVSVLVRLPSAVIRRGEPPVLGEIVLQNTGAGHSWPTGSPFQGARLDVRLRAPNQKVVPVARAELGRTLEASAPWRTVSDTRLAAGEQRSVPLSLQLGREAAAGEWTLVVELVRTVRGVEVPLVVGSQAIPIRVE